MSLVKTGAGLYLRDPRGGVEDVQRMKDAGFDYICVNSHDFSIDAWDVVFARADAAGMPCGVWKFVRSDEDVNALRDEAKELGGPMIVNAEKPLDHGEVSIEAIADACREMDAAISTEPQLYGSVDWSRVKDIPIQIQLFPQENATSRDPRGCRAHAFERGPRFVHFMLGIHELAAGSFPQRRQPYTVYTADDCANVFGPWAPQPLTALTETDFPMKGPGYGPASPSGKPPSEPSPAWRSLKRVMHNAGFGTFTDPDDSYEAPLVTAMVRMQDQFGIQATGDYGRASYNAIGTLVSAIVGQTYAADSQACEWMQSAP